MPRSAFVYLHGVATTLCQVIGLALVASALTVWSKAFRQWSCSGQQTLILTRALTTPLMSHGSVLPALPTDAHEIIAREALRQCRSGLHAWLRLSLVCKDWAAALCGAMRLF